MNGTVGDAAFFPSSSAVLYYHPSTVLYPVLGPFSLTADNHKGGSEACDYDRHLATDQAQRSTRAMIKDNAMQAKRAFFFSQMATASEGQ